jgi:hypothetical protein
MKKNYLLFLFLLLCSALNLSAQVTISGGTTAAGSYTTLASAITALNGGGALTAPVTVDVVAGHTESLTAKIVLTMTGDATNTITIQKNGAGVNPKLISYTGTVATPSVLADGFFVLAGTDYVTIDGIDLEDKATNTTTTTVMEFGYGLFKASVTDGCQNNTIKNCKITLNRVQNTAWTAPGHNGSCGIAMVNGLHTATGALTITAASGSNSFNKFYSNTIQNCNAGISIVGFVTTVGVGPNPDPFSFFGDLGNDIGGTSAATGNTILNFGGGAATNPATGIFANNQWSMNCSYNTLNNNTGTGVNHTTTLRGIFFGLATSTSASLDCNNNNVTIFSGGTTAQVVGIESGFGATAAGNTININNNTIAASYLTATSGAFYGIWNNAATPATLNMNGNTITSMTYSAAALAGSGAVYPIYNTGAATTVNMNNNTVRNVTRTGTTGGTTIGIYTTVGTNQNVIKNTIKNISIDGTGAASILYGIQTATGTIVVDSNTVDSLRCIKTTGTSALYGIYDVASPTNENYNYNTISNITHNGTGIVYGLFTNTAAGTRTVSNNNIFNISTAGTTVAGILQTNSSPNIFKNKIYNIRSTSTGAPTVSGLSVSSVGTSGVCNIYNNYIGDIRATAATSTAQTAPVVRGINITSTTTTSNFNISYNTVYLNASTTGTNFATAGLFVTDNATATTSKLTLQNNLIINNSTPAAGAHATVAYQRSAATAGNYDAASSNNLFYAGVPGAKNLIYNDGTNSDQLIVDFKTRVTPRESNSITEDVSTKFLSTTGSDATFLHINATIPTQIEGSGIAIATITDDYDGDFRNSPSDIGADEGNFTGADLTAPTISSVTLAVNTCSTVSRNVTATISDASGLPTSGSFLPKIYFRKNAGTYSSSQGSLTSGTSISGDWTFTIDYATIGGVASSDVIDYYIIAQDIASTPNISSSPLGVVATDVNTITAHPTTPLTYAIYGNLSGTYTVGSGGNFATLAAAINTYNNSCLTGAVIYQLTDLTYNESVAILDNSYANATNTLTIYPTNPGTLISGNTTNPTIDLNGAKYVTIDGRVGGTGGFTSGVNLVVNNTNGAASAVRLRNEASNNNIKYADLQSNNNTATANANAGIVSFAGTTGVNGNDNNTISYCDIHNITGGTPTVGISSLGTTTTDARNNEFNTISNCNIYDVFSASIASAGVYLGAGNGTWTISDNRVFQTLRRTFTSAVAHRSMWITPNTASLTTASGFVINNNFIGGGNKTGTATDTLAGTVAGLYYGMDISVGLGATTNIQGNTFTGINMTSTSTGTNAMMGINIANGNVDVINNLIGSASTNGSITYTAAGSLGGFIALRSGAGGTIRFNNNTISGIDMLGSSTTIPPSFNGIAASGGSTIVIKNNTVGGTLSNSINGVTAITGTTSPVFRGIIVNSTATGLVDTIANNTVSNITNNYSGTSASNTLIGIAVTNGISTITDNNVFDLRSNSLGTGVGSTSAIVGIFSTSTAATTIRGNKVHSLYLTNAAASTAVQITGLFSQGSSAALIEKNFLHSFAIAGPSATSVMTGMDLSTGTITIQNNYIRLGIDATGTPTASGLVRGISKNTANSNIWFNTVYIGGNSQTATAANSFAFQRSGTGTDDVRNNIFVNERTNGGTGKNYQAFIASSTTLNIDYNNYFGTGIFAYNGTADVAAFTSGWVASDANSRNLSPELVNPTGTATSLDLHIHPTNPTIIENTGTDIPTVTEDYDGQTRSNLTPTDMGADAGNFVKNECSGTPVAGTASISGTSICISGTNILSLSGFTNKPGITLQWKESSVTGGPYTNVSAGVGMNSSAYTTDVLTANKFYVCELTCASGGATAVSNEVEVIVNNPIVSNPINGTRCGTGIVSLSVTPSVGAEIQWYSAATGGNPIGNGTTFTSPVISTSTDYYAAAINVGNNATVTQGAGATTSATYSNPFYSLWSNIHTQHLITAAELAASGMVAGDINSVGLDITAAGTLPMLDFSLKIGTTNATNMSAFVNNAGFVTVHTRASLMPTTGINVLTFSTPFYWDGISNIVLEFCHGNSGSTATMSRTAKADNTSYVSTIKTHNTVGTSGSSICGNTTSNVLTYSVRPQFIFNAKGKVCESPRTVVSAIVNAPPAFAISANKTICNNAIETLSVTSNLPDYDSYTWSPLRALYSDAAATSPYSGTNASTIYLKSDTAKVYKVIGLASNSTTGCQNRDTVDITVMPNPRIVSNIPSICVTGSANLTLSPATGYGLGSFQWSESLDGITYNVIAGANAITYTTSVTSVTLYHKMELKDEAGVTCPSLITDTIEVFNPQIVTTSAGSRCGTGTVNLSATANLGNAINWYTAATGGTPIGTGATFTTPIIATTTDFYVAANQGYSTADLGLPNRVGATTNNGYSDVGLMFNALQSFTLESVAVYPIATTPTGNVTATIALRNSAGTTLQSVTVNLATSPLPGIKTLVPLNFTVPAGTGHRLVFTSATGGGITGFIREATTGYTYPYTLPGIASITSAYTAGASSAFYYYFYDWKVSSGCESPRTAVTATVTTPPAFAITTNKTICNNAIQAIDVITGAADYNNFTWELPTNLFTDAAATTPYFAGNSTLNVYLKSATSGVQKVIGIAENSTTGCSNRDTIDVNVLPVPTVKATPDAICVSGTSALSILPASGYTGATFQWSDSNDGVSYSPIATATTSTYNTPTLTTTKFYSLQLKDGSGTVCAEPFDTVVVSNPLIATTTPASRCGSGTVILEATPVTTGASVNWYSASTGGSSLGTGNTFTTPVIGATTTFFAAAGAGAGVGSVGALSTSIGTISASTIAIGTQSMSFNVKVPTTIISMDIYPTATIGSSGTIQIQNSAGTIIANVPYTTTVTGGLLQTVILNVSLPIGNAYKIGQGTAISLNRNTTGASYPYTSAALDIVSNTFDPGYFYFFYNWKVTTGCEGTRVPVVATVNSCPTVNAKVFLSHADPATGLMDDYIKSLANFPTADPYATVGAFNGNYAHVNSGPTATVTPTVLATTGNNAIVDWVFVELRQGASGSTTVTATKAGLLQKDGDIVGMDGVSPLQFNAIAGNYYIAIRHRNHTGFRTDATLALSNTATTLNFTNNSVTLYGAYPLVAASATVSVMNAGDSNSDGSIDAFDTIVWEIQNGLFDDYTNNSDYNMDGSVDAFDTILWELNNGKYQELD